jgi:hypothetical protein
MSERIDRAKAYLNGQLSGNADVVELEATLLITTFADAEVRQREREIADELFHINYWDGAAERMSNERIIKTLARERRAETPEERRDCGVCGGLHGSTCTRSGKPLRHQYS